MLMAMVKMIWPKSTTKRKKRVANRPSHLSRNRPPRKGMKKLGIDDMDTISPYLASGENREEGGRRARGLKCQIEISQQRIICLVIPMYSISSSTWITLFGYSINNSPTVVKERECDSGNLER